MHSPRGHSMSDTPSQPFHSQFFVSLLPHHTAGPGPPGLGLIRAKPSQSQPSLLLAARMSPSHSTAPYPYSIPSKPISTLRCWTLKWVVLPAFIRLYQSNMLVHFHTQLKFLPPPLKVTQLLEIDIVISSSLFMCITYYSVMTDTNECD